MNTDEDWSNSDSSDEDSERNSSFNASDAEDDDDDGYLYSFNPNLSAAELQQMLQQADSDEDEGESSEDVKWESEGNFTPLNCGSAPIGTTFHLPSISAESTPFEIFSVFVPQQELAKVCLESARYVEQYNKIQKQNGKSNGFHNFAPFTTTELYRFLALGMATGIINKPSIKDYWSTKPLHNSSFFNDTMSRNRFKEIKRSLHFCDNDSSDFKADRMLKLGHLPSFMMEKFSECIIPGKNLCIDESLAKYKGRLSFKQYIPNTRARFGVKLYVLADCSSKFVIKVIPYQGETTAFLHDDQKAELGYGGAIVRSLMDPYLNTYRVVFIDNYFNSPTLVKQLTQNNTGVVGTARINRKNMPKFTSKLKKGDKETFTTENMLVERWMDRREVTMLNNCIPHIMQPNSKSKIKPSSVLAYNKCMGAVDELDKSLQPYYAERKCLKWYQKIWLRFIYIAALNSLRVMNSFRVRKPVPFKDFLETLIQELIDRNPIEKALRGRPASAPSADSRLNGRDHFPHKIRKLNPTTNKLRSDYLRCVLCTANSTRHETAYECTKCNVRLCVGISGRPCFEQYHSTRKLPSKKRAMESDY